MARLHHAAARVDRRRGAEAPEPSRAAGARHRGAGHRGRCRSAPGGPARTAPDGVRGRRRPVRVRPPRRAGHGGREARRAARPRGRLLRDVRGAALRGGVGLLGRPRGCGRRVPRTLTWRLRRLAHAHPVRPVPAPRLLERDRRLGVTTRTETAPEPRGFRGRPVVRRAGRLSRDASSRGRRGPCRAAPP
ncbi:hypothetical protein PLANTIT3_60661 [Plantibacter sp. T3]|nr:hypothetical protein PLANTIT3_60661 [Plantibacter sp. T3]